MKAKFCRRCGQALVIEDDGPSTKYDEKTGRHLQMRWLHCPCWKGGRYKRTGLYVGDYARGLDGDGTASWAVLVDYLDCSPEVTYPPAPAPKHWWQR